MGWSWIRFDLLRTATPFRHARVQALARGSLLFSPALALWLLFVVTGLRGVDYGFHWDEGPWHLTPVRNAVASGILLPRSYIYPTFDKWLALWPSLWVGLRTGFETSFDAARMQAAMLAAVDAPGYLLAVRRIFIVSSSLGIFWMYGAALAFRMKWWAALLAAAGLGLSWEFAYHARFVAADCLLTQFSALVVFFLALYQRTARVHWLYAASLAAGLATGTKYTGVFLLLPILLSGAFTLPPRRVIAQMARAGFLCGLSFATYLVTTPGTLIDPFAFLAETRWIATAYSNPHGGYTASSGWDHARIALEFLAISYFSRYKLLAAVLFASALVGVGLCIRNDRRTAAVLVVCPVVFLVLFCARYRIAIVRNYMWLAPFLSILMATTFSNLGQWLSRPLARRILGGALLGAATLQATWLVRAGESIRHVNPKAYVRSALAYTAERPKTRFRLSPRTLAMASEQHIRIPPNATSTKETDEIVFFARAEGPGPWGWKSNDPSQTKAVFGPAEVNFDWYASWEGHDRVVIMTVERARATNVPVAR